MKTTQLENAAKVQLVRGSNEATSALSGFEGEVVLNLTDLSLKINDGAAQGWVATASNQLAALSQLVDSDSIWTSTTLAKVSQLANDSQFWKKSELTKVSQLENNSGYKTGYCTYCSHCTYCQKCSRCNNVQCSQVQCGNCNHCTQCFQCRSTGNCGDSVVNCGQCHCSYYCNGYCSDCTYVHCVSDCINQLNQ